MNQIINSGEIEIAILNLKVKLNEAISEGINKNVVAENDEDKKIKQQILIVLSEEVSNIPYGILSGINSTINREIRYFTRKHMENVSSETYAIMKNESITLKNKIILANKLVDDTNKKISNEKIFQSEQVKEAMDHIVKDLAYNIKCCGSKVEDLKKLIEKHKIEIKKAEEKLKFELQ